MNKDEALRMALEALEYPLNISHEGFNVDMAELLAHRAITAIKEALSSPNGEAQPEQKQNLKLMPREATREMLEAMDECSMEGYDERLYAGHAASVYMAAWDAFHGQLCYCGDITNLGVIHRDDGPCHYPDHKEPEQEPDYKAIGQQAYESGYSTGYMDCAVKMKAQPEQEKERCVGCEACIDTACGRDECPKGWPKAAQPEQEPESNAYDDQRNSMEQAFRKPEQEPVAWRYKPAREDNPRWEYTTNHPLDMGDGYIRPSLVEYCKCIEPLYAKEKPKLMLEKFREMEDLLEEPAQQEPATKEKIREAIVFNLPLYTTPPQRKPLPYEKVVDLWLARFDTNEYDEVFMNFARAIEAAHGIK